MLVYVHIPFCKSKCAYCDFNSVAGCDEATVFSYLTALNREIDFAAERFSEARIDTVYIGGGTPSSLDPRKICAIVERLSHKFPKFSPSEITVEVNPESTTEDGLRDYRAAGVNRISMGVQSLNDDNLRSVGRLHDARTALEKLELAGHIFNNVSADLIIGLPYDTEDVVKHETETLAPIVKHLSVYELTLEEGTPLCDRAEKGIVWLPSDDETADFLNLAVDVCERCGLHRYEVSNFARDGFFSRHNHGYWMREEYIGLGAGAHSLVKTADGRRPSAAEIRFASPKDINAYIAGINCVQSYDDVPRVEVSVLTEKEIVSEYIMLGLRTTEGIPQELVADKNTERVKDFLVYRDGRVALNRRGFEVMNSVLTEII